jgi:hypothetical protein
MSAAPGIQYSTPSVMFDDELERQLPLVKIIPQQTVDLTLVQSVSPFNGYHRSLTAEGGFLIHYNDAARGPLTTTLRFLSWLLLTSISLHLIAFYGPSGFGLNLVMSLLTPVLLGILVTRQVTVAHSVEIQPDRMILDGKDVFLAAEIGDHWPQLVFKNAVCDRAVIAGVCGTRYIEFLTANRMHFNDMTPELLEFHMHEAMEQLWDRTELSFGAA